MLIPSALLALVTAAQAPSAPQVDVTRIADGVHVAIVRKSPSLYFEPNSVFIIGPDDVIVVDAQFSLVATQAVLARLRRLTDKPVRYVINTHGHDDHITGNQVWRDTFPGVEFIAHRATRDTMTAVGDAKRDSFLATAPGTLGYFRSLLTGGKGPDGAAITAEERAGFASDSLMLARFLSESPRLTLVPATRVVEDRLLLRQGPRAVEVLFLGTAHSAGDLVVHLPAERVVVAGDLVVAPVPLVGSTSHPRSFARALARLRALRPAIIVPGHGPVQRDDRHAADVQRMLEVIVAAVDSAVARGDSLPAIRRVVDLAPYRDRFAGTSKLQRFVFANYVSGPAVAAAHADAVSAGSAQGDRSLAIVGAGVVTMRDARVLRDATVVLRDGRVVAVGPSGTTPIPEDARRVDGRGRWVIPGLADMHAHLFADDYVGDASAPTELGLFLAHGVTTARIQIGRPLHLDLRRRVREGTLPGPRLWVSSPHLTGDSVPNSYRVRTAADARSAVQAAAREGYDLIKLTTNITPEVFDAVMAEARARGMRVTGHVDPRVGVMRALAAGLQVEHLDNYMESSLADSAPSRVSVSDVGAYRAANWASLAYVDARRLEALAGATARAGVRVTPTLAFFKSWFATRYTDDEVRARPEYGLLPEGYRTGWERSRAGYWRNPPTDDQRARYVALRDRMVRAILDSGGAVMAGSDGPSGLMSYGWMLHRELEALVAAGLSPYEALRAATVVPAEYLGVSAEQGTVEVGKRADLVLLEADPLADIRATAAIVGVVAAGRYHDARDRAALVEDARARLTVPRDTVPVAPTAEQEVLAVVQRLFDAMRVKDTATIRSLFDPDARLFGMRPGRDGGSVVQRLTAEEFAAFVGRDARGPWIERVFFPEVRITGTLATVWAEYDFHFGDTFSHCGTDALQLLRTDAGWRIVSLADTFLRTGCGTRG